MTAVDIGEDSMSRAFFGFAVSFAAVIAAVAAGAEAATLSLVGTSEKVCQLTGETDWATNTPTAARTMTNFGMDGTDLGFPIESGSALYLLFGDTWPINHPPASIPSVPPDDALGWTTRTAAPGGRGCLDLKLATARRSFAHPTVTPAIKQGLFDVPSGGIFLDNRLYAFFWTDHCAQPSPLAPDPVTPLSLPAAAGTCLEIPVINSVGRSVLAWADTANPVAFHQTISGPITTRMARMPSGFVYVTAAQTPPHIRPILQARAPAIAVFGAARYRASIPYLAMAPRATFSDPATWSFFAGITDGHPVWVTRTEWESGHNAAGAWTPPAGAEIFGGAGERCVGEHSVTWNAPLHAWLMLYNCGGAIKARSAPEPWGPWSAPTVLLSAAHDPWVACTLVMTPAGCPGLVRRNYWPTLPNGNAVMGGFYAPFVLNRYTQASASVATKAGQATIYWIVSTWNPYNVVVMKSTLAATD
jgi:hypothetical protein